MSRPYPILKYPIDTLEKEALVAKALADRGIPRAVFDFIRHNLGDGAAVTAILVGEYRKPEPLKGVCGCS